LIIKDLWEQRVCLVLKRNCVSFGQFSL